MFIENRVTGERRSLGQSGEGAVTGFGTAPSGRGPRSPHVGVVSTFSGCRGSDPGSSVRRSGALVVSDTVSFCRLGDQNAGNLTHGPFHYL